MGQLLAVVILVLWDATTTAWSPSTTKSRALQRFQLIPRPMMGGRQTPKHHLLSSKHIAYRYSWVTAQRHVSSLLGQPRDPHPPVCSSHLLLQFTTAMTRHSYDHDRYSRAVPRPATSRSRRPLSPRSLIFLHQSVK